MRCTCRTRKVPTQIFGNVQCPILYIKTNIWRSAASAWRFIWKKSRLNWKLIISNAADNVDIIQSQARDTSYRRIQEVNKLCVSK